MHISTHLDLDVVAHEAGNELSVLVELTAPSAPVEQGRQPATLVVVLDRSGSMRGERLEGAKTALIALVDRLDPQDRFGLVTFDANVELVVPARKLADKSAVKDAIAAVFAGGSTDLSAGYLRGIQEARRVASKVGATVLLVSDGHANAGLREPGQLGDIARKAHANGVTTSTLGFGLGYDELLLSAIASGGTGNELFAETADDAIRHISGEVTGLLSLSAQAASLVVRMSKHVRAVRIINDLSGAQIASGVIVELGSFYSGETRKLVLTFDVPGIPALGLAEVATLEFTYVALPAVEEHSVRVPLHVNVVPGDQAAGRIPDPIVRTELAFQRAQQEKRSASTALSAGDTTSALSLLQNAGEVLKAACAIAPPELTKSLFDELADLAKLIDETQHGDSARAAKLTSWDASFKSRTRGRVRPSNPEGS